MNNEISSFEQLSLRSELLTALTSLGYEEPTPIQAEAVPPLLAGQDLLGQAATGTGKTAAFALPMLQALPPHREEKFPCGLVLVPTRELAVQVSQAFHRYGKDLGVRVLPIYGGQPIGRQLAVLKRGVDVVIATPGRARDHLRRGTLDLSKVSTVVLDEADEMLDMGFAEELEEILNEASSDRQTVLFSATMPKRLNAIATQHLRDPRRITMSHDTQEKSENPRVRQTAYLVARAHKPVALGRVLDVEAPGATVVFCRTREEVDLLTETMNGRGYRAEALHGGVSQDQREKILGRVRSAATELLIATDVAARGLDIAHLTHVVNYNVPAAPEAYVHRIGRVGRAGREGVAITLAEPREHRTLKTIERNTKQRIRVEQVPTVADLHARRAELTRAALHEILLTEAESFEHFRVVLNTLSDEFNVMDVALAAVKLAHDAMNGEGDEEEIPAVEPRKVKPSKERGARSSTGGMIRIYLGVGRKHSVRPKDLVGAITGESSLRGKEVGSIEITDRFSLVEIPESAADSVLDALQGATIRGKKVLARRDRESAKDGTPKKKRRNSKL